MRACSASTVEKEYLTALVYEKEMERYFSALPPFLQQHSLSVGRYAQRLVEHILWALGSGFFTEMGPSLLPYLYLMGKYHDIGKSAIANEIWQKNGALTEIEKKLVEAHTYLGSYIIRRHINLPQQECGRVELWEAVAQCCQYHHECWNGSGYPLGAAGRAIPLPARIIGIADAYDAMTADRPYHRGLPWEKALEEIQKNASKQFDPTLALLFCQAMQGSPNATAF